MTRPLTLHLHAVGICSAAGGAATTAARLAFDAQPMGVTVLDERDCTGDPITALPACMPGLPPAVRIRHLVQGAIDDLLADSALSMDALRGERLFIVNPESAGPGDASALVALQTWLDSTGVHHDAQTSAAKRVTFHDDPADALMMARSYLQGSPAGTFALVVCAETWLSPAALQRLDASDMLRTSSSDGVVPGESATVLRLAAAGGIGLTCAFNTEPSTRWNSEAPLGTRLSELMLAVAAVPTGTDWVTVLRDRHASQRPMSREEEFIRRRNWVHLPPTDPDAWIDSGRLGYLGHGGPIVQIALLARLEPWRLPALACARSLWRHNFVCARLSPDASTMQVAA